VLYQVFPPHPLLAPHVTCCWYLRRTTAPDAPPDRILPDGRMELIFNLRAPFGQRDTTGQFVRQPPAILFGQLSRFLLLQPSSDEEVLAVRFTPAGARTFFHLDLDALTDRHLALEDLGRPWRELTRRVIDAPTVAARLRLIERTLLRQLPPHSHRRTPIAAALDLLHASAELPRIAAVAQDLGLSTRQLERTFRREVGLTPKHYARLVRFRRMLTALDRAEPRWADLAAACGYSDQPHLVREFRELTGLAPRACLAAQTDFAAALVG
jgi:AraC-like DNA-binding protein